MLGWYDTKMTLKTITESSSKPGCCAQAETFHARCLRSIPDMPSASVWNPRYLEKNIEKPRYTDVPRGSATLPWSRSSEPASDPFLDPIQLNLHKIKQESSKQKVSTTAGLEPTQAKPN
jgi:hypothetical protein